MARMFRVLAFFTLVTALMSLWGNLQIMALLFFAQTGLFIALSYIDLSEKSYMTIFMLYLFAAFTGFMYYAFFGDYPTMAEGESAAIDLLKAYL